MQRCVCGRIAMPDGWCMYGPGHCPALRVGVAVVPAPTAADRLEQWLRDRWVRVRLWLGR